ncbi:MAG: MFS transporter [Lentisphaerae bacterium]|jgi:MFS family permease|nr:MFS transporter [Lentisphaerota bacterium]MBT5611669.1 MFS transporter [Lentisphaerota bacterium]MBT7060922.1 MFS transporter [Lentisphaerota bacterium]MBT7842240.1 MFS transporter [Lentisphaerota bacterium]
MRIQTCPALMDWLLFLVLFAVLYAAGARGFSLGQCAWLGGIFQIAYLMASPVVGMFLSRRNARAILIASTTACTVFGVAALLCAGFVPLMVALGLTGMACSCFFNSFQTYMRGETEPGDLARTVSRYTLAWSCGSALGFLSSGIVYGLGIAALAALDALVGGAILFVLLSHRRRPHHESSADDHVEQPAAAGRPVDPVYVLVGWCLIFTAMFIQRPVHSLFPAICARNGITSFTASLPLAGQMLIQGGMGYVMFSLRHWLYRRTPLVILHILAGVVFLLVWRFPPFVIVSIGISLLGIYTGFAYFSAVYYASNSLRGTFNVGVNECLVGVGSFAGLFASEWWSRRSGTENAMFLVCGVALFVSVVLQMLLICRRKQS